MSEIELAAPNATRLVYDAPEASYHADRSTLSSSGAKHLLQSPKAFRYEQDNGSVSTPQMHLGSLTHAITLENTGEYYVGQTLDHKSVACPTCEAEPEQPCRNPKTGKENSTLHSDRRAPEPDGISVGQEAWDKAHRMAEAVHAHPQARELLADGKPEVSAYGTHSETSTLMRGRFDYLRNDGNLVDLKTTSNAHPDKWARQANDLNYGLQASWYWNLAYQNGLTPAWFRFIVVDSNPPHNVLIAKASLDLVEAGWEDAEAAMRIHQYCRERDEWPDFWMEEPELTLQPNRWRKSRQQH